MDGRSCPLGLLLDKLARERMNSLRLSREGGCYMLPSLCERIAWRSAFAVGFYLYMAFFGDAAARYAAVSLLLSLHKGDSAQLPTLLTT